jgi:peptide-methionine (R)-S-oxide reductase
MMDRRTLLVNLGALVALPSLAGAATATDKVVLTDAQWKARLSPETYRVMRHDGTEMAFSSPLDEEKRAGTYYCAGCALAVYSSKTKYDSGTGWPSFWAPLANAVATRLDTSYGFPETEVHCRRCDGHLGHVYDDGPPPTGKRYCMDGVSLVFKPGA